jgi:hypothetical protein
MQKLSFALGILILPSAFHSVQSQTAETRIKTATVSGRVVMKGEPARNILVYLRPLSSPAPSNPDAYLRARTDEGGRFRITGLAAGIYDVIPLAPGFVYSADDGIGPRGKTVKVSEGENVENVDIEIYRGGVITGRVTDSQGKPLVRMQVLLSRLQKDRQSFPSSAYGPSLEMYMTDERGVYRIFGLPVGRYLVSVGFRSSAGPVPVSSDETFYPQTFHPKAANESEAKVIEVTEGSESAGVDITLLETKPARSISGWVIDADTGRPVEGIWIAYHAMSDSPGYTYYSNGGRSGANGEFVLKRMAPGKYQLVARAESENKFFSDPVPCDLGNGDAAGVEIKVRLGGSISGVVVIEGTDDPKALAKLPEHCLYVDVWSVRSDTPRRNNPKINADGSFHLRGLPPGWARIGYAPKSNGRDFSLARVELNGAVVRSEIVVAPGKPVTAVRVVLVYNGRQQ